MDDRDHRDEKPVLPEDAVEDLTPEEEGESVTGGAAKMTVKFDSTLTDAAKY